MDGGSALEAQQRIGAEIPFENISATQRGMGMALGAFYHAAEMSRKRQQLENQLLMADQKNKEQERWHDIEMENFRQNAVTRMMSLENRGAAENAMLQAKADRLALDQEKFQTGVDKYRAGVAGERGLFASFGDPDAPKPGSKGFENYYWNKLSEFAEGADRPGGRILAARLAVEHNKNASRQWDKLNSDKKQFVMDAGTDLGLPVDPLSRTRDLAALEHPEMWKQQYRIKGDKSGKTLGEEVKSQPDWEKKYEATDQRYFPIYTKDKNGNTVIDHYVT